MSTFGISKRRLSDKETKIIEGAVERQLLEMAEEANITDPVIRDLLPDVDLGETSGNLWQQSLSALSYRTVYSGKNPEDRIFIIYGAKNSEPDPITTAIRFIHGANRSKIKDIWQVEDAWLEENTLCYAKSPVLYRQDDEFNIDFHANENSGTDNVILLGKVVETKGKIISPTPQN